MEIKLLLFVAIVSVKGLELEINNRHPALDESLYEDVLDAELCHEQIRIIRGNPTLQIQFADAGIRTPRGVAQGNFADLGNYHQCLGITHEIYDMTIQGKYCTIQVPLSQNWSFTSNTYGPGFDQELLELDEEVIAKVGKYKFLRAQMLAAIGVWDEDLSRSLPSFPDTDLTFRLAVCVPKPCTTQQAMTFLPFNLSAIGFHYEDDFCRLPDDKPWSPADTVAVVLFSAIGIFTLMSTTYDLINTIILKKGPKQLNRLYTSFSAYTNGRRLMNFSSPPGTLHCLDGIRTWAMLWVVVGHSFITEVFLANPITMLEWLPSLGALWIIAAPITVDTFFCIAGILVVYTTVGKMNGVQLLKNLPIFYLNRLLRLFPLLAAAVLLQASFFNRMSDGPYWRRPQDQTDYCRSSWWVTLLHLQNYLETWTMCISQSWYIAIDVQLYIVSPIVLFWVLGGNRKVAWAGLVGGLLVALSVATIYNFLNNFPSGALTFRPDTMDYYEYYYFNTLTRASPFFVGMLFGYVLHIYREEKVNIPWMSVAILWTCAASISTTIFFYPHFIVQPSWDNQIVDNVMNSFMRPAWAAALCWMVFACTHGYGGPVNWFLTLDIWKLPARIAYAIFIFHYPLMFVINGSEIAPVHFSVAGFTFKSLAHITLSIVVAYFATLLIDAPFSTLSKLLLEGSKLKKYKNKSASPTIDKNLDSQVVKSDEMDEDIQTNENKNNDSNDHRENEGISDLHNLSKDTGNNSNRSQ